MIITMKNTETREISAKIDELHEERGEAALGRVLTLLISTNETSLEHDLAVANNASREHPCRVIAIAPNSRRVDAAADDGKPHTFLDAEVRFGSGNRTLIVPDNSDLIDETVEIAAAAEILQQALQKLYPDMPVQSQPAKAAQSQYLLAVPVL